jgi:DNA polymerase-3 subunit alpha
MGDEGPEDGHSVTVAGLVTSLVIKRNKKGEAYAVAQVEDLEGAVEVFFFPKTYLTVSTMLSQDSVVVVKGRVSRRDESLSLYASDLTMPDISDGPRGPVVLTLDNRRATAGKIEELKSVLASHPGATEVRLRLVNGNRLTTIKIHDSYRVNPTEALYGDLKVILGPRCLSL